MAEEEERRLLEEIAAAEEARKQAEAEEAERLRKKAEAKRLAKEKKRLGKKATKGKSGSNLGRRMAETKGERQRQVCGTGQVPDGLGHKLGAVWRNG